jgi:2-dehydropantoate 2-reductase
MGDTSLWDIAIGGTIEAYSIAIEKKVNLSFKDPIKYVTNFGLNMPNAKPSMLLDHISKRRSEIGAINGMIPILGRELGILTPYSDTIVACVKYLEEKF